MTFEGHIRGDILFIIINEDGSDFEPSNGQQLYNSLHEAQNARLRPTQDIVRLKADRVFKGCNCSGDWQVLR